MFTTTTIVLVVCVYMILLFGLAQLLENRASRIGKKTLHPVVYALAITVFCTSWTFYGSVGLAAESGLVYLAIYLGAIAAIFTWPHTLKRMIHAKETYHATSIADFISTRYNRSQLIAALVTIISLCGVIPYIALQLRAVIHSVDVIAVEPLSNSNDAFVSGLIVTLAMAMFTIIFGARKLDPTERHVGMMNVLAVQCVVKLVAFLAVGVFVTFSLYDGFGDLLGRFSYAGLGYLISSDIRSGSLFGHWITLFILGAAAIQFLPRQFHIAVVENSSDQHIHTATWLVPVYLIAITVFVIPITGAGLLEGLFPRDAQDFILLIPQMMDQKALTLLVFIGGFSAAVGMIIISAMTLSTMVTNHLLMVLIDNTKPLASLRQHLLLCRWLMIILILFCSFGFAWEFEDQEDLLAMGTISFAAALQFAPAVIFGMFWKNGNKGGAFLGLLMGFLMWFYTLIIPAFAEQGWVDSTVLYVGLMGVDLLRPEALFGIDSLSQISHGVLWSLTFNIGFYLLGSWLHTPNSTEQAQTNDFMAVMKSGLKAHRARPTGLEAYILLEEKKREAEALLSNYLSNHKAEQMVENIIDDLLANNQEFINIVELLEFHRLLENALSGAVGSASAHSAIDTHIHYSERETQDLHTVYNHLSIEIEGHINLQDAALAETPDGSGRYNFIDNLQNTIEEKNEAIRSIQKEHDKAQLSLDSISQKLFDIRLTNQKLTQENARLKQQIRDQEETLKPN